MFNNSNSSDDGTGDTKRILCRVSLNDLIYFCISFISLVIVPLAGAGVFQNYWELNLDKQPVMESIFKGVNCSDVAQSHNALLEDACTGTFNYEFTLFQEQDDFFFFKGHVGHSLCNSDPPPTNYGSLLGNSFSTTELPTDVHKLFEGNFGQCSNITLKVTEAFAFITLAFAIFMALWLTVISSHYTNIIGVHLPLAIVTMISSLTTIGVFAGAINPGRSRVDTTFCASQSLFEDCNESIGAGFYCQIAVAALSFATILICALDLIFNRSRKTICCVRDKDENNNSDDDDDDDDDENIVAENGEDLEANEYDLQQGEKRPALHKNIHIWIKFGRFLEFFLAILSFALHFSSLDLSISYGNETNIPIEIKTHLWDYKHGYCNWSPDILNMINMEEQGLRNSTPMVGDSYGDCKSDDLAEVYFGFLKVIVFGGLALFLKRNAQKNPFFYLAGILSDVVTIIFVIIAIETFYTKIYPGRSEIEHSYYCDQFDGTITDNCTISLGPGFWVLCAVLVLTVVNFVVEFTANEVGQEYGAMNAFKTVLNRVRKGRMKSAIMSPGTLSS